jgi:hypothetical protein
LSPAALLLFACRAAPDVRSPHNRCARRNRFCRYNWYSSELSAEARKCPAVDITGITRKVA